MSINLSQMQNDLLRNLFLAANKELVDSLIKEREQMDNNLQKKVIREVFVELEATYTAKAELCLPLPDHIGEKEISKWLWENEDLWLDQLEEDVNITNIQQPHFSRGDDTHRFVVYENEQKIFSGYL
jgi:hypothetical protein